MDTSYAVAVVAQRRWPVASLRNTRRRLRRFAAGDARHAAHRIDAGLGQINLGYHQQRYASPCDLLDPYRNLAIAAEILKEQHTTTGEGWFWQSVATTVLRAESLPPAIGAACPATLPVCRARAQPPRHSPRARRHPHDETPI